MKTDREILNRLALQSGILKELTQQEKDGLKKALLTIYRDIVRVCVQNGLTAMLAGGSCLGAIRHKGFIPWDDDLDLIMFRKDYDRFVSLLENGILGTDYEFSAPGKNRDSKNLFLKVYRKCTLCNELHTENAPFPKGIYIDIFPIDNAPANRILRAVYGFVSNALHFISTSVLYSEYRSPIYQKYVSGDKKALTRYRRRLLVGRILGVIPHRKWVWWFDRFNARNKTSGVTTIPTGRRHYMGEILPEDTYLPVQYAEFEGIRCAVPGQWERYLSNLYGDYMKLPPVEKRERHFVYQFDLGNFDMSAR